MTSWEEMSLDEIQVSNIARHDYFTPVGNKSEDTPTNATWVHIAEPSGEESAAMLFATEQPHATSSTQRKRRTIR